MPQSQEQQPSLEYSNINSTASHNHPYRFLSMYPLPVIMSNYVFTSGKGPIRQGSCKRAGTRQLQLRLQIDSLSCNPLSFKDTANM
jgi:hypothetical protein